MIASGWTDYEVLATGNGEKLERWGNVYLLRPDPQVIWPARSDLKNFPRLHARYIRSSDGGGRWETIKRMPEEWKVAYGDMTFLIKPMGFKHTGLFPEQAVNWVQVQRLIRAAARPVRVLNLFAYTGGATVACAAAGAFVTHVDAAKGMVDRAKQNCALSGLPEDRVRFIVDDCQKFVQREIKRGKKYDAVILDPPSYGRGPTGETWKIEDDLYALAESTQRVLCESPLFYLINSYTTGLQASVMENVVRLVLADWRGTSVGYEVVLPTTEKDVLLPCGNSALWKAL